MEGHLMTRMLRLLLLVVGLPLAAPAQAQASPQSPTIKLDQDRCEGLLGGRFQSLPGAATWVTKSVLVPASATRQAVCSVTGYVNPANNFGLYLPLDNWNGKYLVRGCGGSCGNAVVELACGPHMRDGYACLITDMGHPSSTADNVWVDNNLQGLVDFGYRSTHVTTLAGKAIAEAFYGRSPTKSLFFACSTGGRQGLIEAQRFPLDFDGIVAIALASLQPSGAKKWATIADTDAFNTGPGGLPILPNRKAVLIHRAVVAACDRNDGIKDGLIGDPTMCRWQPEALACTGSDTRDCLTAGQVAVAHKMYEYRGAMRGSELNWIGNFINAPLPGQPWTPLFDLGVGRGDPTTIESMVNPNNPDLRPFRDRGGKLILVQGWSDYSVMPPPALDHYQIMTKTMDGRDATRQFARLFMIPGMDHCSGGEGAGAIDYMNVLSAWVDGGPPPEKLHGVHPVPGAPIDFFGITLPQLDRKYYALERDHYAWPKGSVAVGLDRVIPSDPRPLADRLTETLTQSEKAATAANYPRPSILNSIIRATWTLFYTSGATSEQQPAALIAVSPTTPVSREAMARMKGELALH